MRSAVAHLTGHMSLYSMVDPVFPTYFLGLTDHRNHPFKPLFLLKLTGNGGTLLKPVV